MKYIKAYEDVQEKLFWKVPTEMPYFEIALDKIGVSQKFKDYLLTNNYIKRTKTKNIYVPNWHKQWNAYNLTHKNGKQDFLNDGYVYQGKIKITPEDIEKWKFNQEVNKYNL